MTAYCLLTVFRTCRKASNWQCYSNIDLFVACCIHRHDEFYPILLKGKEKTMYFLMLLFPLGSFCEPLVFIELIKK